MIQPFHLPNSTSWSEGQVSYREASPVSFSSHQGDNAQTPLFGAIKKFWRKTLTKVQEHPLVADFRIIFERDPAARNVLEVLLCYPGFHALLMHRVNHWLYQRKVPFFPRFFSHLTRLFTGIEIHPGAQIGKGVFIDHGMGVVIGETAIVGDYTLIYQGVTLGGTGKDTGKRHPTIGTHAVVGAGAKVLGNILVGDRARVGAGSIVLRDVPAGCTAVGVPGRNICRNQTSCPLEHHKLPDAEAAATHKLYDRIQELEEQVQQLQILFLNRNIDHVKHYQ
jgi:serine O-acetyltransferase